MRRLDNSAIRSIATAVIAAVDKTEERAYNPFDGDFCRFAIDTELDLDDSLGLSGHVTGEGTAWYVTEGNGYDCPVTTVTTAMSFTIDSMELWDSQTDEPEDPTTIARVTAILENWYPNGKIA